MKSMFFDSQVTYDAESGRPVYDRPSDATDLRNMFRAIITTGVYPNPSTNFQVLTGTEDMTVNVQPGLAWIEGAFAIEDAVRTLIVQASATNQDRIDRVILRLNLAVDARTIDLYVLEGTPATTPIAPELTRNNTIYEIALADLFISRNTTAVSQQRISDTRGDANLCGWTSGVVDQVDTTTIFLQYKAWFEQIVAEWEAWWDGQQHPDGYLTRDAAEPLIDTFPANSTVINAINTSLGFPRRKNLIINGEGIVAERGNQWNAGTPFYGWERDRWLLEYNGNPDTSGWNAWIGQSSKDKFQFANNGAAQNILFRRRHVIEIPPLEYVFWSGKDVTISWYASGYDETSQAATGQKMCLCVGLRAGSTRNWVNETIEVSDIFTMGNVDGEARYSFTYTMPESILSNSDYYLNTVTMVMFFVFANNGSMGAQFPIVEQFPLEVGVLGFGRVQAEFGSFATEFEYVPVYEELKLCRRYWEKDGDYPNTQRVPFIYFNSGNVNTGKIMFQERKAQKPDITVRNGNGTVGGVNVWQNGGAFSTPLQPTGGVIANTDGFYWGSGAWGSPLSNDNGQGGLLNCQ